MSRMSPMDPNSFSRPEFAMTRHMSLHLDVDFERQVLSGEAILNLDVFKEFTELPLDINKLKINSVEAKDGSKLQYEVGDHIVNFSSKLTVKFPKSPATGEKLVIKIKYSTDPSAPGLHWLKPVATLGKKHPYLYSQLSQIFARSMYPCQDSPRCKITFDAEVTAPEGFTVLMSALRDEVKNNKFKFHQPILIPPSLLAIAVGMLECRTLGPRANVWSEKEDIERCATECKDTEKYIQAAEKLLGPYDWTQYDVVVLPPGFPHGGMENACLTFISPTLNTTDKSMIELLIHEIVHSWIGNSLSIPNFEHYWFKEGMTVFLQRKISASLISDPEKSKQSLHLDHLLGVRQLIAGVNGLGANNPLTRLVFDLNGVHPTDAFSIIPYEKGSIFFMYLELLVGGPEEFNKFILSFATHYSMQTLNSEHLKMYFMRFFKNNEKIKEIDWVGWFYKNGMPPVIPKLDTTLLEPVTALVTAIKEPNHEFSPDDVKNFGVQQMIHLLQQLIEGPALSIEKLNKLHDAYNLAAMKPMNGDEVLFRWLRMCIRSRDESKLPAVFSYLNGLGRLKYVRPLYCDLYAWEKVRQQAIDHFLAEEEHMNYVTAYSLRKDLHLCKCSD